VSDREVPLDCVLDVDVVVPDRERAHDLQVRRGVHHLAVGLVGQQTEQTLGLQFLEALDDVVLCRREFPVPDVQFGLGFEQVQSRVGDLAGDVDDGFLAHQMNPSVARRSTASRTRSSVSTSETRTYPGVLNASPGTRPTPASRAASLHHCMSSSASMGNIA